MPCRPYATGGSWWRLEGGPATTYGAGDAVAARPLCRYVRIWREQCSQVGRNLAKFLVLYAHPLSDSFGAEVHRCVLDALGKSGHQIDDCDLYAENFSPVMTSDERRAYHDPNANTQAVLPYIERLLQADGLVLVYPTWWYGMPAILRGYIDRVWLPGVAFELVKGRTRPLLQHITRFAVVTTYGSPWWLQTFVARDPNRHALMHGIRYLVARRAKTRWLALYGLDYINEDKRRRFLERVGRGLQNL